MSLGKSAVLLLGLGVAPLVVPASPAAAAPIKRTVTLKSIQEVPAISSNAKGTFVATLDSDNLEWQLSYSGLSGGVTQAHIHFAQAGVNGGIMLFLCSNLGNGPVGTSACPASGSVEGVSRAADIVGGAVAQGLDAASFFEFQRALRQGIAYVNVHSTTFPGGELRGQLKFGGAEGGAEAEEAEEPDEE